MIIYGIKNCDKVRAALKQARQQGHDVRVHDFRDNGIDQEQVQAMLSDIALDQLVNKRSTTYRQLSDADKQSIDSNTLVNHPTLIKRPVVFYHDRYTIGLPE